MTKYIPSAAIAAGLDESKVADLMAVVSGGASALKEYSPAVATAAEAALSHAYCKAILYVFSKLTIYRRIITCIL